jgi:hypothetical protein
MTPTPSSTADASPRISAVGPSAGVGVSTHLREAFRVHFGPAAWHLALCVRCDDDLSQPFRQEPDRDAWAAAHVAETGHVVRLVTDGLEGFPSLHLVGIISRDQHGDFRYVCPADDCATSCGPFPTAELAIASWRTHGPVRSVR